MTKIRESFDYEGFNLKFYFLNGKSRFPIEIDLTTGEKLLPLVEKQKIPLIFEDGFLELPAYPLEQILADKLYTTLAYGAIDDKNSRMKDLYDIYFLTKVNSNINYRQVAEAINQAKKQRNVELPVELYTQIIQSLANSKYQHSQWKKYQQGMIYAKEVSFDEVMMSLNKFTNKIVSVEN